MSPAAAPLSRLSPDQLVQLQGQVVWLSGAASGIGKELALMLSQAGCTLVLADIDEPALVALNEAILASGGHSVCARCDVTSWESQRASFEVGRKTFGRIDIVLPNAGVALGEPFVATDATGGPVKPSLKTMDINLTSVLYSAALAFHYLSLSPAPAPGAAAPLKALVLTGSMASLFGTAPEDVEYSASKAGVLGILHGLRERCDDEQVRLALVAPYFVKTPLLPDGFEPPLGWTKIEDVLHAFLLAVTTDPWPAAAAPDAKSPSSRNGAVFAIPGGDKGLLVMDKRGLMPLGWVQAAQKRRAGRAKL